MAVIDPRKFSPSDYKASKIGTVETPREAKQEFWLTKGDERKKVARDNVQDMIKHLGWYLEGPVKDELTPVQNDVELKAEGPKVEAGAAAVVEPNELDVLRARATELGVSFYPTTGKKNLAKLIAEKEAEIASQKSGE